MTLMQSYRLTKPQQAFIDTEHHRKAFIGGRQVGKTRALLEDALEKARDGQIVGFTAPTNSMAGIEFSKLRDLALDGEYDIVVDTKDEIIFESGGVIELTHLRSLADVPKNAGVPSPMCDFTEIVIDEIDQLDEQWFKQIKRDTDRFDVGLSVSGTARINSVNLLSIITDLKEDKDSWFLSYDRPHDVSHVNQKTLLNMEQSISPVSQVLEYQGMIVIDPSEFANFTRRE